MPMDYRVEVKHEYDISELTVLDLFTSELVTVFLQLNDTLA